MNGYWLGSESNKTSVTVFVTSIPDQFADVQMGNSFNEDWYTIRALEVDSIYIRCLIKIIEWFK